jgi:hypothetical protein
VTEESDSLRVGVLIEGVYCFIPFDLLQNTPNIFIVSYIVIVSFEVNGTATVVFIEDDNIGYLL